MNYTSSVLTCLSPYIQNDVTGRRVAKLFRDLGNITKREETKFIENLDFPIMIVSKTIKSTER